MRGRLLASCLAAARRPLQVAEPGTVCAALCNAALAPWIQLGQCLLRAELFSAVGRAHAQLGIGPTAGNAGVDMYV
jgi:hypothetical protein